MEVYHTNRLLIKQLVNIKKYKARTLSTVEEDYLNAIKILEKKNQIKQKHGIIERENYNKPKSEKGGQPECPKEKEIAIEDALKYFQMIPSES